MLQSLIEGKDSSQCILIEDNLNVPGRGLLKCFLNSLTQRYDVVHVMLYDVTPSTYIRGLPPALTARLRIHDGATDPLGWTHPTTPSPPLVTMDTDLSRHLSGDVTRSGDLTKAAVVVDSLDALILHRSASYTCQTLHRLGRLRGDAEDADPLPVVALLHADLHDDVTVGLIRHMATSCIHLGPPRDPTTYQMSAQTVHRRPSGKVVRAHEELTLKADLTVGDVADVVSVVRPHATDPAPDPTAGVTFNLSLSEGEREARSRLVLPYTRPQHKTSAPEQSSAKIFYQPDDADDFDEEDPDDDLDI